MSDYIVFDPNVANGGPFFKGTRISVAEVLQKLAGGQSRESILQAYGGQIKAEAIVEAAQLAALALATHAANYVSQAASAPAATPGIIHGVSAVEFVLCDPAKTNYGVGERVCFRQKIQNHTAQDIKYGILGMLAVNLADGTRSFHTSWSGDLTLPANGFGPQPDGWEDGLFINAPGSYRITLDMCFASMDECQKSVGWETLTSGTIVTIGAPVGPAAPATAAGGASPVYTSRGLVGNEFRLKKMEVGAGEEIWFHFKVTNTTDAEVPFGLLSAFTESGQFGKSWTNDKLRPHQVLEWDDHLKLNSPGAYKIYLGICYDTKDNCFAGQSGWERLSDSVTLVVR